MKEKVKCIEPNFQAQILKDGLAVILSEKDCETSLCINGLEKIDGILDVVQLRDMLDCVIKDYFDVNGEDSIEQCDCDECCESCDEHVGPCYVN